MTLSTSETDPEVVAAVSAGASLYVEPLCADCSPGRSCGNHGVVSAPAEPQAAPERPLSPQQAEMVKRLRTAILKHDSHERPKTHEFKRFELTRATATSPLVFLQTEVGRIGDEGTEGETYCRIARLISITRLGGVSLLNGRISDREKQRKTYRAPRVRGFRNVVNRRTDSLGS